MGNLAVFPHFRQSDQKRNCGAACMAMLLKHYKMRGRIDEITEKISEKLSSGIPSCRNYLIIQYALQRGITCSVVSATDPKTFIPYCLEHGINMFISYHANLAQPFGHFALVTNSGADVVFINDPAQDAPAGINCSMTYDDLLPRMKCLGRGDEITHDNVFVLLSPKSSNVPIRVINSDGNEFPLFCNTLDKITAFLNPYKDQWDDDVSILSNPSPV